MWREWAPAGMSASTQISRQISRDTPRTPMVVIRRLELCA
jgi:hypothetical protein